MAVGDLVQKSKFHLIAVALSLGVVGQLRGEVLRIATGDFAVANGSPTIVAEGNASESDAWNMGPKTAVEAVVPYQAETQYYVGIRARAGEEYVNTDFSVFVGGTLVGVVWEAEQYRDSTGSPGQNFKWFCWGDDEPAWGYYVMGPFTRSTPGNQPGQTVKVWNNSEYYLGRLDEVVLFTSGEGYNSAAEAEANPYGGGPPPPYRPSRVDISVNYDVTPILAIRGDGDVTKIHQLYFTENGEWISEGPFTDVDLLTILDHAISQQDSHAASGYDWQFSLYWQRDGIAMQNRTPYYAMLGDWMFAECARQVVLPSQFKLPNYNRSALGAVWSSTNRGPVAGDPLGDIAWRLHLEMTAQSGGD